MKKASAVCVVVLLGFIVATSFIKTEAAGSYLLVNVFAILSILIQNILPTYINLGIGSSAVGRMVGYHQT